MKSKDFQNGFILGMASGGVVEVVPEELLATKQDTLVSGENIKTINGQSILGEGDISISGGSDYTLPIGGDELGGVKNGGNVVINEDGTMTAPASGGSEEEWVELLNTTLTEDVAYVDLVAPDGKKFKKLHIHIHTNSVGLSTSSKIIIKGSLESYFTGGNGDYLTTTSGVVGTWNYPTFIIEKGELFPIAFCSNGSVNGTLSSPVYMGGVGQSLRYGGPGSVVNNGPWKLIRIQPQTVDVVFKAGVVIYAWGVYE